MAGFGVVPPGAAQPGGLLNPTRSPFWGLNDDGGTPNEDLLYYLDPWDTFFVNDVQFPGRCEVQGKSVARLQYESRKGKDEAGSGIVTLGYYPGEFDVVSRIATPEQWTVYLGIMDMFWAGPTKADKVPQLTVKVKHPDLTRLRIFEAVITEIPLAEPSDVDGAKNFRWKFHERVKQKAKKATRAGAAIPPISKRQPDVNPKFATPATPPSATPANMSLDGPPMSTVGGVS